MRQRNQRIHSGSGFFGQERSERLSLKGTKESTLVVDSLVPLTHNDPKDLRLICLVKKHK